MPNIGPVELIIILVIALLILGPGRLPDVGSALGKSIREFRKEKEKGEEQPRMAEARSDRPVVQIEARTEKDKFCPNCGEKMSGGARFCMGCGAKLDNYAA